MRPVRIEGDQQEPPPEEVMEHAEGGEEGEGQEDLGFRDEQDVPHQEALDVLVPGRGAAEHHHRGRRGHDVDDPDEGFLRHAHVAEPGEGEEGRADEREEERHQVGDLLVGRVHAEQDRDRDPERRDLGQGEVHEDDPALDDVQPEVHEQSRQQHERQERPEPESDQFHRSLLFPAGQAGGDRLHVGVHEGEVVVVGPGQASRELGDGSRSRRPSSRRPPRRPSGAGTARSGSP